MRGSMLLVTLLLVLVAAGAAPGGLIYTEAIVKGQADSGNKPHSEASSYSDSVLRQAAAEVGESYAGGMSQLDWDWYSGSEEPTAESRSVCPLLFEVKAEAGISFDWHVDGELQLTLCDYQGMTGSGVVATVRYDLEIYDDTSGGAANASKSLSESRECYRRTQWVHETGTYDFNGKTFPPGTLIEVTLDLWTSAHGGTGSYGGYGGSYYSEGWGEYSQALSDLFGDYGGVTVDTLVNLRLIPEPATLVLLGLAGAVVGLGHRLKR